MKKVKVFIAMIVDLSFGVVPKTKWKTDKAPTVIQQKKSSRYVLWQKSMECRKLYLKQSRESHFRHWKKWKKLLKTSG